jgi:RNA polymerase-interacting CarD/CdnL/TRCF family regulator
VLAEDLSTTFRRLISANEAKSLLEKIRQWDGKPKKQWKARAEAHQNAIESGDPLECAKVLKGLTRVEAEDKLRIQDRDHLKRSMELLTDELSRALKKRPAQTRKMLDEAVSA